MLSSLPCAAAVRLKRAALQVENLAPHQQPSVVAHNSSLQFQEDGNGRAHLRGFVVKDTDLVRVTFERECQTPMNCEWAAT